MADAPPSGPPPPRVPPGWKAVWSAEYRQFFFVNTYTKESVWTEPTEPARPQGDAPPPGPPPGYSGGGRSNSPYSSNEKANPNNPYNTPDTSHDEEMARRLQAEEQNRSASRGNSNISRGAADSYYSGSPGQPQSAYQAPPPGYDQSQAQQTDQGGSRGLLGKLAGKFGGGGRPPQNQGYPQQGGYGGGPPQGYGGYGGGYGGPPQGGYSNYGPPPGQYYGGGGYGAPPPQQYAQQAPKKSGIGTGTAVLGGVAAAGATALAFDAFEDHEDHLQEQAYDQGYDQGYDNGNDDGGDFGGGDF